MTIPIIHLVPGVHSPEGRGPERGMYAMQKALIAQQPPWLRIGGADMEHGVIPWFWHCREHEACLKWVDKNLPFVVGPNMLFYNSYKPCNKDCSYEEAILNTPGCRLIVTESHWYRRLIEDWMGPRCRARILVVPYPIYPQPPAPLPVEHDLLIYWKSGCGPRTVAELQKSANNSIVIRYGEYARETLIEAARRSACCVYLSNDDRGPLAAAEIALTGCPLVGIERGCPWSGVDGLGIQVTDLSAGSLVAGSVAARNMDRQAVRQAALVFWQPSGIAERVLEALSTVIEPFQ